MKKISLAAFILGLLVMFGCTQGPGRQQAVEVPKEEVTTVVTSAQPEKAGRASVRSAPAAETPAAAANSDSFSAKELQRALKNAGFYDGEIDGKIGPKTNKAIIDFQAKNNLEVDGKVGPKTWGKLKGYLNSPPDAEAAVPAGIKD